jgi:CRISPR-associated protein Cas1
MANSLLYGCAAAVCSALALNPALGIIHHGDASAFLFDIADLYKLQTAVPAAFAAAQTEDPKTHVRRAMRRHFRDQQMLSAMMTTITELFGPHRQAATSDQLLDDAGYVPGGHNYGQPCS